MEQPGTAGECEGCREGWPLVYVPGSGDIQGSMMHEASGPTDLGALEGGEHWVRTQFEACTAANGETRHIEGPADVAAGLEVALDALTARRTSDGETWYAVMERELAAAFAAWVEHVCQGIDTAPDWGSLDDAERCAAYLLERILEQRSAEGTG